jgi:GGDEF domain-containing protein
LLFLCFFGAICGTGPITALTLHILLADDNKFSALQNNPSNQDEVADIATRIVATINEPMEFRGKVAQVGTSIGIALYPTDGQTSVQLIKSADTAMYAAKDAGKNTYRFFQPTMTAHAN